MSKLDIDVTSGMPSFKTLVEGSSSIGEAYVVSVQVDEASKLLAGAKSGVFGVLRHYVEKLYAEAHAACNGQMTDAIRDKIAGDFLLMCQVEEQAYAHELPEKTNESCWKQAKSDLKQSILMGFDFYAEKGAGQKALATWRSKTKKAEEKAKEEALQEAAAKRKQASGGDTNSGSNAGGSNPSDAVTGESSAPAVEAPADLNPEVLALLTELTSLAAQLSEKDVEKTKKMLNSWKGQIEPAVRKAFGKIAAAA